MSRSLRLGLRSALVALPLSLVVGGGAAAQDLSDFGVVAGQSLTNTGPTIITGDIAVSPGTSYTGSGSVVHTGTAYLGDAVAARIQDDLTTLYLALAGRSTSTFGDLTGQDLGGRTLAPGVYNFDTSAMISAGRTLTLDAGGDPNAVFIFNVGSTLTAESGAAMVLENGAQGGNVFFRVGSSATLDTSSALVGQIVALTSISMNDTAGLGCGAAYARNGSVTLINNTIGVCVLAAPGIGDVVDVADLTEPELAVVEALGALVAAGGQIPIAFAILAATQTPEELALSLAQLPGQVATGVAPMGLQSMDDFLDAVVGSGRRPRVAAVSPRDPGVPIGMVRADSIYTGKHGPATAPLSFSTSLAVQPGQWDVWASAYGSRAVIDGNARRGWQKLTSENRGLALGLNHAVSPNTEIGIALSLNDADFELGNGFGSGTAETVMVAVRARTSMDAWYVEGALAHGRSDITTERVVTIAGVDRLVGETDATNTAAHLEAGYHMGPITPFAGLRAQSFTMDPYSETAASGTSSYALRYGKHTTTSLRSELGLDMAWSGNNDMGGTTGLGLRIAWARELASNDPGGRSFVTIPGATFRTTGAAANRDSVLVAATASVTASNGFHVGASINAQYSGRARDVGGSIVIGHRW